MKQTHRASIAESLLNIAIGFGIQFGALYLLAWAVGASVSLPQNLYIAIAMTIVSFIRTYALRRFFEFLKHEGILP